MLLANLYTRTPKGALEIRNPASTLPPELQPVLMFIDGRCTVTELSARLRIADNAVRQAVQRLHSAGYIEPAPSANDTDADLDFTAPGVMPRLQAQAEARARAEAAAQAQAEQARREAAAARLREHEQARAQQQAEVQATQAAQARARADAAARAADEECARAAEQATAASNAESRAAAQARMEAALLAETRAAAEARKLANAESVARNALTESQTTAARAREETQARARAESEAEARAHAEAHARAMVEAQVKTMSAALARAQALAREEADARARLTADLQAREAMEAQARADAAARARAQAEVEMRAELVRLRREAQQALEEADARAEAERQAREAAEALAEQERAARATAEARAAAEIDNQRKAHAAARAATQARVEEEIAARQAAEARAQAEARAHIERESTLQASAEEVVRRRVAEEISAREEAERAADAEYRTQMERRAQLGAAVQKPEAPRAQLVRKPFDRMFVAKAAGIAAVLVVVGIAIALPAMPLDGYVPRVEKAASALLQQPVRVGQMQYRLLPSPVLVMSRVSVGPTYGTRIDEISVSAWPWELFDTSPRFDFVTIRGAFIEQDGLSALRGLVGARRNGVQVERAAFEGARVMLQDLDVPVSNATVQFQRNGAVRSMTLMSGGATLEATPQISGGWRIAMNARKWRSPLGSALVFDSIAINGVVAGSLLQDATLRADIAGGELTGSIAADWRDGVRAEGRFRMAGAQLQLLMPAHTSHFTARGTLTAEGRYRFESPTIGKLLQSPRITADFRVASGELVNIDLLRALQQVTAKGVQGGRTRFEQLSGTVEVTGDRYRYRQLKLSSGAMSATGDVEVAPGNPLAGRVSADVQTATRTAIRGMFTVSGTLTNPVLKP